MPKGVKKIKFVPQPTEANNSNSIIGSDEWVTVPAEKKAFFDVKEWYKDTIDIEKKGNIVWMVLDKERKNIIETLQCMTNKYFTYKVTKKKCGYPYYIEASLTGKRDPSFSGLFLAGYCDPKIVSSKWCISNDGQDVRKTHPFSYGNIIYLGLDTEGINGNIVNVEIYRTVQGGKGTKDDQHIFTHTQVKVIDGEINLKIGNTFFWYGKIGKPRSTEEFYVKVKDTSGKYITDGSSDIHARFLRVKNTIASKVVHSSTNNTPVKIGNAGKPPERISLGVVYFRPLNNWNGEFGFDWLREKDNGLTHTSPSEPDPAYADIIEGGYLNGTSDLSPGPTGTAYAKLKTQYIPVIPVLPNSFPAGGYSPTQYFVPYLTLFSKAFVDTLPKTLSTKPKFEAHLQMFVALKADVHKLEFEYDTNLLTLDKNILKDKTKTNGLVKSQEVSIKITCKKDLPSDKEIIVYVYPKNSQPRMIAGKIIILKNNASVRKKRNFILVGVKTNVTNVPIRGLATGIFGPKEKINLYNSLHQALIVPTIIENARLDVSANTDLQPGGIHLRGIDIFYKGLDSSGNFVRNLQLYHYLNTTFLNRNKTYAGYFTIFKFGVNSNQGNVLGAVEDIGIHNVMMFTLPKGDDCTLNHEILHGLGLCHTHNDGTPIKEPKYKYTYPSALINNMDSTDNVMSYRAVTRSTWRWQWNIINSKIAEK